MNRDKIKQVEQYRKKLIDERRKGFNRVIKNAVESINLYYLSLFTFIKLFFIPPKETTAKVDILLLQHSEKVIKLNRKTKLKAALKEDHYSIIEIAFTKGSKVIRSGYISKPKFKVPLKYLYHASYAEYLVNTYNPKIFLNDRNGMLLAPFLRDTLNRNNAKFIQLAHATTVEDDWQFSMNDYDFYFLFGQSSYDFLKKRKLLFGKSRVVLTGSHMIDESFDIKNHSFYNGNILLLGMGPDREKTSLAEKNYGLILEWISKNKDHKLFVKPHPRSNLHFWKKFAKQFTNIELLSSSFLLSEALRSCSSVITIESNAILEASLAKRPIIYVNTTDSEDIFSLEKHLGKRVKNINALNEQITDIAKNYKKHVEKTECLQRYHLSDGIHGLSRTISSVNAIYHDKEITDTLNLP